MAWHVAEHVASHTYALTTSLFATARSASRLTYPSASTVKASAVFRAHGAFPLAPSRPLLHHRPHAHVTAVPSAHARSFVTRRRRAEALNASSFLRAPVDTPELVASTATTAGYSIATSYSAHAMRADLLSRTEVAAPRPAAAAPAKQASASVSALLKSSRRRVPRLHRVGCPHVAVVTRRSAAAAAPLATTEAPSLKPQSALVARGSRCA